MEYVEGHTLHDVLQRLDERRERLSVGVAAAIIAECCVGLDHAHALHVVHRDVSAKNIMISYEGEVKLLDFGIAKGKSTREITKPGKVRGTSGYIAPEQVKSGPITGSADLWALGVNLYRMLTGVMPFQGKNEFAVLSAIADAQHVPVVELRPEAPMALCESVERCLSKSPSQRPSAMALRNELEKFLEAHPAGRAELKALMERLYAIEKSRDASVK
jgi:serine/threonine protein kinase